MPAQYHTYKDNQGGLVPVDLIPDIYRTISKVWRRNGKYESIVSVKDGDYKIFIASSNDGMTFDTYREIEGETFGDGRFIRYRDL